MRTTRELVEELRRAEFDEDFVSPVIVAASRRVPYHLFWDDIDKLKLTDFKTEVLFDLVDSLHYRCIIEIPKSFIKCSRQQDSGFLIYITCNYQKFP